MFAEFIFQFGFVESAEPFFIRLLFGLDTAFGRSGADKFFDKEGHFHEKGKQIAQRCTCSCNVGDVRRR